MQMTVMNCAHDKLAREERGSHGPAEHDWGGSRRSASLCGEVGRKRRARCCHAPGPGAGRQALHWPVSGDGPSRNCPVPPALHTELLQGPQHNLLSAPHEPGGWAQEGPLRIQAEVHGTPPPPRGVRAQLVNGRPQRGTRARVQ